MSEKKSYWQGPRPSDGKRWAYTTAAEVLTGDEIADAMYRMYRRYAKQWNDIELDMDADLSEHTHTILGAKAIGSMNRKFILDRHYPTGDHWILELHFARGFKEYYPGFSTGRNALRSPEDIRSIRLHWKQEGRSEFKRWVAAEKETASSRKEWTEYRA